jgi:AcrR family transcriptional regulator
LIKVLEGLRGQTMKSIPLTSSEQTRKALVGAALRLFGEKGFDGTSTRDIAALANANIGSIAYHFGGKEGLRAACAAFIVETIQKVAAQALAPEAIGEAETAADRLEMAIRRMVGFILGQPEAGAIVQFILRELAQPTAALDAIYDGVFAPSHRRLCELWADATGEDAESDRTKITVFTMIGQVIYFRIGREAFMRRMGWSEIGPKEIDAVTSVAVDNLAAVLAAHKRTRS